MGFSICMTIRFKKIKILAVYQFFRFLVLSHSQFGKPSKAIATRRSGETTPLWDEPLLMTHIIRSQQWEGNSVEKADDEDVGSQVLMFDVVFQPSVQLFFFPCCAGWYRWCSVPNEVLSLEKVEVVLI